GLPAIPLVPVSSTQVVVGSVIGVGMVKGVQEIKFKTLGIIAGGWILTPLLSGITTFFALFFVQSVFGITVTNKGIAGSILEPGTNGISNINVPVELVNMITVVLLFVLLLLTIVLFYSYHRNRM